MRPVADLRATLATLDELLSDRDRFAPDRFELMSMRVAIHDELIAAARDEGGQALRIQQIRKLSATNAQA